jgi:hypothetical protein
MSEEHGPRNTGVGGRQVIKGEARRNMGKLGCNRPMSPDGVKREPKDIH